MISAWGPAGSARILMAHFYPVHVSRE
jgi:hypothetical protein